MNNVEIIKNNKWHLFGRWKHTGMFEDGMSRITVDGDFKTTVPFVPKYFLVLGNGQFITENDYREGVEEVKEMLKNDDIEFRNNFKKMIYESHEKLTNFNFDDIDSEKLKDYLLTSFKHTRYWFGIMLADGALQELLPSTLPEKFVLLGREMNRAELVANVALPKKDFPMILGEINLLKIAQKISEGDSVDEDLEKHAREYGWTNSLCWWTEPFDANYYREEAKRLSNNKPEEKLKLLEDKKKTQHQKAELILAELKKNFPEAWKYLDIVRDLADLKEENWDTVSIVGARNRKFFKKIATKYGLSYNQLFMMTLDEFLELLKNDKTPDVDELNQRIKCFCVLASKDGIGHSSGQEAEKLLEFAEDEVPELDHLEGTPIWQGKETGIVNIVHTMDDIGKMNEGDILVCPMTDPDYLPAIRKAKAIVTNQGGMLCHAAIVARELQIPCVVGTKFATKFLQDGDLVEVNANEGVIKKI